MFNLILIFNNNGGGFPWFDGVIPKLFGCYFTVGRKLRCDAIVVCGLLFMRIERVRWYFSGYVGV